MHMAKYGTTIRKMFCLFLFIRCFDSDESYLTSPIAALRLLLPVSLASFALFNHPISLHVQCKFHTFSRTVISDFKQWRLVYCFKK